MTEQGHQTPRPELQGVVLSSDWQKLAHHFAEELVERWDDGQDQRPLHEFMGLTTVQYAAWVEGRYGQVFMARDE